MRKGSWLKYLGLPTFKKDHAYLELMKQNWLAAVGGFFLAFLVGTETHFTGGGINRHGLTPEELGNVVMMNNKLKGFIESPSGLQFQRVMKPNDEVLHADFLGSQRREIANEILGIETQHSIIDASDEFQFPGSLVRISYLGKLPNGKIIDQNVHTDFRRMQHNEMNELTGHDLSIIEDLRTRLKGRKSAQFLQMRSMMFTDLKVQRMERRLADREDPNLVGDWFEFDTLIPGLREGISMMKPGETYDFFVPYNLAYGRLGCSLVVPPRSFEFFVSLIRLLHYRVTLHEIQSNDIE